MADLSDNFRLDTGRPPAGARIPYGVPGRNNNPRTVAIEDLVPFTSGYRGQWNATTTYELGDIVEWDIGRYFISASANSLNREPNFQNRVYWVAISSSYWGDWLNSIQYNRGEWVTQNNKFYIAKQDNQGEDPATDSDDSHWFELPEDVPTKASQTEVNAGTDNDKFVTPETLAQHLRTLITAPHSEHPVITATGTGLLSIQIPDLAQVRVDHNQNREWVEIGTVDLRQSVIDDIADVDARTVYTAVVVNGAHRAISFRMRLETLNASDAVLDTRWTFGGATTTENVNAQATNTRATIEATHDTLPEGTAKLRWSIYTNETPINDQTNIPGQAFNLDVRVTNIFLRACPVTELSLGSGALTVKRGPLADLVLNLPTTNYRGDWSSTTTYAVGDVVFRSSRFFIANLVSTNVQPTSDNTDTWQQIDNIFHGDWANNIAYFKGDIVERNDIIYIAIADSTNQDPATDTSNTFWRSISARQIFRGRWVANTPYLRGDIIFHSVNNQAYCFIARSDVTNAIQPQDSVHWKRIESDWEGAWLETNTYVAGNMVSRNNAYYLSIVDNNTGHDPTTDTDRSHWVRIDGEGSTSAPATVEQPPQPWDFVPLFYEQGRLDTHGVHQGETTQIDLAFNGTAITNGATGVTHASGVFQFPSLSNAVDSDALVVVKFPLRTSYVRTRTRVYLNAYAPEAPNVVLEDDSFELRDLYVGDNSAADVDTPVVTLQTKVKLRAGRLYRISVRGNTTSTTQSSADWEYAINHGNNSERFGLWVRLYRPEEATVVHEVYDNTQTPNYKVGDILWYEGDLYRVRTDAPVNLPNVPTRTVGAHNATKRIELYPEYDASRNSIGLSIVGNTADHFGRTTSGLTLGLTTYQLQEITSEQLTGVPPNQQGLFGVEFGGSVPAASLVSIERPDGTVLNFSAATRQEAHGRTLYDWAGTSAAFIEERHYTLDLIYVEPEVVVTEWEKIHDINRIPPFTANDVGNILVVGTDRQVDSEPVIDALNGYGRWEEVYNLGSTTPAHVNSITLTKSIHDAHAVYVEFAQIVTGSSHKGNIGGLMVRAPFITQSDWDASGVSGNTNPGVYYHRGSFGTGLAFHFNNPSTVPATLGQILGIDIEADYPNPNLGSTFYIRRVFAIY